MLNTLRKLWLKKRAKPAALNVAAQWLCGKQRRVIIKGRNFGAVAASQNAEALAISHKYSSEI